MSNVVELNNITKLDIPPERVLNKAQEADLNSAIVLGWTEEGDFYFASSIADGADILWLLELTKTHLMKIGLEEK